MQVEPTLTTERISRLKLSKVLAILAIVLLVGGLLTTMLPAISLIGLRIQANSISVSGCCNATLSVNLTNSGFLSLDGLTIAVNVTNRANQTVASGFANPVNVGAGSSSSLSVNVRSIGSENLQSALSGGAIARIRVDTSVGGFAPLSAIVAINPSNSSYSTTSTQIKHVVIIMMENHAFDNIFGVYPTDNRSTNNGIISTIERPNNLLGLSNFPSGLYQIQNGTFSTPDIPHNSTVETKAWDNGMMDGFKQNIGSYSMNYFGSTQFATEWDWAEQYALADMYFQPVLGPTVPNRIAAMTGNFPPSLSNAVSISNSSLGTFLKNSIFAELTSYGITWGYYSQDGPGVFAAVQKNPQFGQLLSLATLGGVNDFLSQLSNKSLPSFSWIDPYSWTNETSGLNNQISQHPPANVTIGEDWMLNIVNGVMSSSYWSSSAIFITYDEGGGYYDHVAPPVLAGNQLGFRIPLIVISPYAKENYVSSTVLTHTSLIAFIDYNWKLPALSNLVLHSNLPLDMFNFNLTYENGFKTLSPIELNQSSAFPLLPQIPFNELPYPRSGSSDTTLANNSNVLWPGV